MTLEPVTIGKSAFPEKAGARTPTALLEAKSMSQYTPTEDSSDAECPTCGAAFTGPAAMKSHHKQVHGESIAGVPSECDYCGEQFQSRSDVPGTYCSNKCQALAQRDRVGLECDHCGETFERKRNRAGDGRSFCSTECRNGFQRERDPEDHPRWLGERERKTCDYCGEQFDAIPSEKGRDRFCSLECSRSYERSEASYSTLSTAVRSRLPNGWGRWRADVRDGECEMCGAEATERAHDLHHIVPILAGGVNDPELLVELCRSCHEAAEAYGSDLPGMKPVLTE